MAMRMAAPAPDRELLSSTCDERMTMSIPSHDDCVTITANKEELSNLCHAMHLPICPKCD